MATDTTELEVRIAKMEVRLCAFDRLMDERKQSLSDALTIANQNNMHWKATAEEIIKDQDRREREFWPRSLGILTALLALLSAVLTIAQLVIGR